MGSGKSEVGSRKWEVRSRKSEVGSGKWEVGSGKWEVGSGKWEVGRPHRAFVRLASRSVRRMASNRTCSDFCVYPTRVHLSISYAIL